MRDGADGLEEPGALEVAAGAWAGARARIKARAPRPLEADEGRGFCGGAHLLWPEADRRQGGAGRCC